MGFIFPSVNIIPSIQAAYLQDFQGDENYEPVEKVKDVDAEIQRGIFVAAYCPLCPGNQ